jgi:DNA invertase Pin-like site-specific DNA recombinase
MEHAEKLGYTIGRVTKEVFSGAELFDRPLLARDRADIRAGQFDAVVVYAIDRLSLEALGAEVIANGRNWKLVASFPASVVEVESVY